LVAIVFLPLPLKKTRGLVLWRFLAPAFHRATSNFGIPTGFVWPACLPAFGGFTRRSLDEGGPLAWLAPSVIEGPLESSLGGDGMKIMNTPIAWVHFNGLGQTDQLGSLPMINSCFLLP